MSDNESKTYHVVRAAADENGWRRSHLLSDFSFPWLEREAPSTELRMIWSPDDQRLHFRFLVVDDDIVLGEGADAREQVIGSDRVELFFAVDRELSRYYSLEMDPRGVVLDYAASFHRQMEWGWSVDDLELDSEMRSGGYSVEGSVSLVELDRLGCVQRGEKGERYLIAGAYRAEFHRDADGKVIEDWIAWVDPKTPTPDFHVPSSFGRFVLGE